LLRVKQRGGACHMGYRSCFFRKKAGSGWKIAAKRVFNPAEVYKKPGR
jgi:phosphoribosyl-AMP cyclohydrolase